MWFFFFWNLPSSWGDPWQGLLCSFFSPCKKKVGGRRKFDIWLMQIIGEFCAPLSFWLSDTWPSSSELSAYFLHTSHPFLDKFSECCAFSLEKTSQLWWQAYREKDRGEVWLGGREREKGTKMKVMRSSITYSEKWCVSSFLSYSVGSVGHEDHQPWVYIQIQMRSCWIRAGLKSDDRCPYTEGALKIQRRYREEGPVSTEADWSCLVTSQR